MNLSTKIAIIGVIVAVIGVGAAVYFNVISTPEPTGEVLVIAQNKENEPLRDVNVKARNYTSSGWVSVSDKKETGVQGQAPLKLSGLSEGDNKVTVFFWKEGYYSENASAKVVRNGQLEPEKAAKVNLWKTGSINVNFLKKESDSEVSYVRENKEIVVEKPSSPSKSLQFSL